MFEKYKEKKHFKKVKKYVQEQIWNGQFAREKFRAVRERVRQNYDLTMEGLRGLKDGLAKPDIAEAAKTELEARQAELGTQLEEVKKNLAEWDAKIEAKANEVAGGRAELQMLTQYLKNL